MNAKLQAARNGEKVRLRRSDCLLQIDAADVTLTPATDDKGPVRFQMVVNSGKPIMNRGFFGNLGIELKGVKFRQKMPALEGHDTTRRLGFTEKISLVEGRGIVAEGRMLRNSPARQVIADCEDGFPFQASCYLSPSRIQVIDDGEEADVNGEMMQGPGVIFRESTMREVTFTPLGADPNTSAATLEDQESDEVLAEITRTGATTMPPKTVEQKEEQKTADQLAEEQKKVAAAAAAAERERASTILKAAVPEQHDLAQSLIDSDKTISACLLELNQDLRKRLVEKTTARKAGEELLGEAGKPLGGGNRDDNLEGGSKAAEQRAFAELKALPDDDGKFRREFEVDRKLEVEFAYDGPQLFDRGTDKALTPKQSAERLYLAYRRNQNRIRVRGFGQLHQGMEPQLLEGGLRGLGFRNITGRYFLTLEEVAAADWVPRVASMFTTDQPMETYKFLGAAPNMQEWSGERVRQKLIDLGFKVFTKKFENTLEIDIDDWRRDKTGQARQRVLNMAAKAATLPQRLITQMIVANPNSYDGVALFASTHSVGSSGTQSNDLSASASSPDAPTSTEMMSAILGAVQSLMGMKDDLGDPTSEEAQEFVVLVPQKYYQATIAALQNDFVANGASNTLKNTGLRITAKINSRLPGTANAAGRKFYTFRTDASIRALIWQDEEVDDAFKVLGPESDSGFWRETIAFGGKRLAQCAPGRFELVNRTTLS